MAILLTTLLENIFPVFASPDTVATFIHTGAVFFSLVVLDALRPIFGLQGVRVTQVRDGDAWAFD